MSCNVSHPGIEFGDGVLKGPAVPGQILKMVGDGEFSIVNGASDVPVGVLVRTNLTIAKAAALGGADTTPCVVALNGGVIQTDQFIGTPTAGTKLSFDAATAKFKAVGSSEPVVGHVLDASGDLSLLLTLHGEVTPAS